MLRRSPDSSYPLKHPYPQKVPGYKKEQTTLHPENRFMVLGFLRQNRRIGSIVRNLALQRLVLPVQLGHGNGIFALFLPKMVDAGIGGNAHEPGFELALPMK